MNKTCRICNISKLSTDFKKCSKRPDGYDSICKSCVNIENRNYNKKYSQTPKGMALKAWERLNRRANNKRGDLPTYTQVEVRMSKSEFLQWSIPLYESWIKTHPDISPSIDRIDSQGHYEIANMQIISWRDNCAKKTKHHNAQSLTNYILVKCKTHQIDIQSVIYLLSKQKKTSGFEPEV